MVDIVVDELDLAALGFEGAAATGRPGYHPAMLLKLYIDGYLNQVQSSRRLEREAGRNVELMWLTGKLAPDFKTIADFRRDHGSAIQAVCRRFVLLCRNLGLIAGGTVAVDGSRMRAVNARDRNFTPVTIRRRMEQVDDSIVRYLGMLDKGRVRSWRPPVLPKRRVAQAKSVMLFRRAMKGAGDDSGG